jgi:hypothetical protein
VVPGKSVAWVPENVPFAVQRYQLQEGSRPMTYTCSDTICILLVVSGSGRVGGRDVVPGTTLILSPNREIQIFTESGIDVFIAYDPR